MKDQKEFYRKLTGMVYEYRSNGKVKSGLPINTAPLIAKLKRDLEIVDYPGRPKLLMVILVAEMIYYWKSLDVNTDVLWELLGGLYSDKSFRESISEWHAYKSEAQKDMLISYLSAKYVNRDALIVVISYFLKNIPKFKTDFSPLLTRDEFIKCA